jgi:hypothetical protein
MQMVITEKLRQRFAKDIGAPIKIFVEPYFSNMLDLYEEHYSARTKWNQFLTLLENFESEQSYFAMYNATKDAAITYLANNPEMKYFCQQEDMKRYAPQFSYNSNSIFKCTNVGKHFVSIDMIKGNFTALRHYSPAIVGNKETYEEFIGQFCPHSYLCSSKYVRQVCFGNANPRRQTTYERYLMEQVLSEIFARTKIPGANVAYLGTDEIVLDVTSYVHDGELDAKFTEMLNRAINAVKADGINVRNEYFKLYRIKGTNGGYMRKYEFDTAHKGVDFKCVEADEMPFVIRANKSEPIQDSDLVFVYNGKLAKLLEAPKIEFTDVWTPEDERKNKGEEDGK